jgi:hypothetical protein
MTRTGGKEGAAGAALVNVTANNVHTTRNEIVLWKLILAFISDLLRKDLSQVLIQE